VEIEPALNARGGEALKERDQEHTTCIHAAQSTAGAAPRQRQPGYTAV
jgi:hypothetical protein